IKGGRSERASVRLYRWADGGRALELVHVTPIEGEAPVRALLAFNGLLLAAAGAGLALYDVGKRRLLRKAAAPNVAPHVICALSAHPTHPAERVLVADVHASVLLVAFSPAARSFSVITSDSVPRHITALAPLDDGATVVGGDKFGSLFVLRSKDGAGKWRAEAEFHVGDIVTSLNVCALAPHARSVILYTTLLGAVYVAVPMVSQSDVNFFLSLESAMREIAPSLSGRDHLAYRSSFVPVKSVVDGDLCEAFLMLDEETMERVSDKVDRSVQDIVKKMEDMRSIYGF
ncbi:hypothetical protein IWW38_005092, partial [Coemansia aciculifera]